jgi:pimeloyl-ACP methyl ester carboxylesterase
MVTEPWRQGGRGYARDNWLSAHAWGFPLQDITIPVHLWHGELDVFSPMLAARYLASHLPDCHPTYYPDGRHDLLDEHGREILTALVAASQERAVS